MVYLVKSTVDENGKKIIERPCATWPSLKFSFSEKATKFAESSFT
jgi:hypothetical protein